MANPRQRRKTCSSSYKPVSHSKHAKRKLKKTPPICGPKSLQDAWDKEKTVCQNYARLGLAVSLHPSTNGAVNKVLDQSNGSQLATSASPDEGLTSKELPTGFGRIIRDDSGNPIRLELNEEESTSMRIDPEVRQTWVHDFAKNPVSIAAQDCTLIQELEDLSRPAGALLNPRLPPHVLCGYMQPLVETYGGNVKSMVSDLKLNPEQRTEGELKRMLRKAGLPIQE